LDHGLRRSIAIDDDLAAVMVDIAVVIALLDDNRVAVAVIVAVANDVTVPIPVTVAVAFADGHAARADTDTNFFRGRRQRDSNKRDGRDNSQT
jgi:prepilin-type processing-associated H-X9-DG protein